MTILDNSSDDILMKKRILYLSDVITTDDAVEFAKKMTYLNAASNETIHLLIDSPGGNIRSGLQICDLIQSSAAPIEGTVIRQASSIGAIIFQTCHPRLALPHAIIRLHHFKIGDFYTVDDFYEDKEEETIQRIKNDNFADQRTIYRIVADACKISENEAKELFGRGTTGKAYTAKEAKNAGLIDEIIEKIPER